MYPIKTYFACILLLAICAVLTHCAIEPSLGAAADSFGDNNDEKNSAAAHTLHKRPSFFVGSRYGRSGAGSPMFGSSKTRRLNVMPRNDRFFLGSRYGKRASEYMSPYEQDAGMENALPWMSPVAAAAASTLAAAHAIDNKSSATPLMMSCVYTGLNNLYRCNNIEEINNIINQLTTAHADDDDFENEQ